MVMTIRWSPVRDNGFSCDPGEGLVFGLANRPKSKRGKVSLPTYRPCKCWDFPEFEACNISVRKIACCWLYNACCSLNSN